MRAGKIGQPDVRLVTRWPGQRNAGERIVLCPFLAGLDPEVAFWVGPLAWHDSNACLLAALPRQAEASDLFAGVYCTDPFRRDADLLAALKAAGVAGVVNLPTNSLFDGEFGALLDGFNVGIAQELDFLRRARGAGFRVAACVPAGIAWPAVVEIGAEFIIAHDGAPQLGGSEAPRAAAERAPRRFPVGPPVIEAGALLATLMEGT